MSKLITINNNSDQALLDELLDSELTIFEDIQGSKIFVNWDGEQFTIKSKNIKADPINLIDEKEGRLGKSSRPPEFKRRIEQLTSVKEKEKNSVVPYLILAAILIMLFELLYIKRRGDI